MGRAVVSTGRKRLKDLERAGLVRTGRPNRDPVESIGSGNRALDAMLPGAGFPRGYLTELSGSASSGKLTIAARALASASRAGDRTAIVTSPLFFPGLAPGLARALETVLVCRVTSTVDALVAAETLATSGGIDLLVVDLAAMEDVGEGFPSAVARLERAVRQERVATILLTDPLAATHVSVGSAAALRLDVSAERAAMPNGRIASRVRTARSRFGRVGARKAV